MVDRRVAEAGLAALGEAIAEIAESAQDTAVRPLRIGVRARRASIAALRRASEDMSALASAMEVLQRRLARGGGGDGGAG